MAADGDNLIKTRLSTGDMNDVFMYNSGSLFQAIDPAKNLVAADEQPWVDDLDAAFQTVVKAGNDIYGAPVRRPPWAAASSTTSRSTPSSA